MAEQLCRTMEGHPITAEIDRTSDPGRPTVRLECGCNEFWLDAYEAEAVAAYLERVIPSLKRGGEDEAAPAVETKAEQPSPATMLDNRINETRPYLRPKCPRCGADTIPFGGGGYVCVNRCDK